MNISGAARLAGVMGWPTSHSRSPRLHGYWLERHAIDGAYLPLAVRPENLRAALEAMPLLGFAGCNLTIPHKEAALRIVAEVMPLAARIGAINTVIVKPDGSLRGDNTDAFGFLENLRDQVPNFNLAAGPAVVLGAGGASRAICAGLLEAMNRNKAAQSQPGASRENGGGFRTGATACPVVSAQCNTRRGNIVGEHHESWHGRSTGT